MSKPRSKKVSLKRTISAVKRRGLVIDKIQDDDVKWLYAGYKKEAFPEEDVPSGLDVQPFIRFVEQISTQFHHTLVMRDADGRVLTLLLVTQRLHILEARTYHMPWTASRDRLGGAIMYFAGIAGEYMGIKYCGEHELGYCRQLARYGVLRPVGELRDFYRVGETSKPAIIYQTSEVNTPWTAPLKIQMQSALSPR